eukprot:scaffold15712_cov84-Isochrysis_galbana.AAC.1
MPRGGRSRTGPGGTCPGTCQTPSRRLTRPPPMSGQGPVPSHKTRLPPRRRAAARGRRTEPARQLARPASPPGASKPRRSAGTTSSETENRAAAGPK